MQNNENEKPLDTITVRCSATWSLIQKIGALFKRRNRV